MENIRFEEMREEYLGEVLDIYTYYVLNTTFTFHMHCLSMEEMRGLVFFRNPRFKAFVILEGDAVIGYVYLAPHGVREAYDSSGRITVYLRHDCTGRGIGKLAVRHIEAFAREQGFHVLVASMCGENEKSMALFERCGFLRCAHYREIGRKFDRWLDVMAYQKVLD